MNPMDYAEDRLAGLNPHQSTGPKTVEGKRRSSLNATRHSLTGQIVIFTPEEGVQFEKHCASLRDSMAPVGAQELELAQAIAEDRWRMKRARALENSIFAKGHEDHVDETDFGHDEVNAALAQAATWKEQARNLNLLTIYEQRINRTMEKNTARLDFLQATRKAAFEKAQEEAILLAGLALSKGEVYHPAPDFPPSAYFGHFVYASSEIDLLVSRSSRLEEARARRETPPATAKKTASRM
jgi:hypothetical protein